MVGCVGLQASCCLPVSPAATACSLHSSVPRHPTIWTGEAGREDGETAGGDTRQTLTLLAGRNTRAQHGGLGHTIHI